MAPPPHGPSIERERLRRADPAAFRELYARHAQATFRFLLHLTGRRDLAEDLHQETWLSIAGNLDRLAPDSDLAAWVFTIARNKLRSARRVPARAVLVAAVADVDALERLPAGARADDDPTCRDLQRALGALPDAHREILWLMGVEELDAEQAAAVLGIRPDAARQRLSRARAALADALDPAATEERRGAR